MIELLWNAPTSEERMASHVEALSLPSTSTVLDVGCGCGEFLIRLFERFDIAGIGIDASQLHIEEAQRRALGRTSGAAIQFIVADARSYSFEQRSVDLAVCLGATHAFGEDKLAYSNALQALVPLVKPGGMILIADGYLKKPASPEYRELLGDSIPDSMTHGRNVATGIEYGLVPLAAWTASDEEWDDFEWGYQRIVERKASEQPHDLELAAKLSSRREWMQAYLQEGRETLGYGTYLFRLPASV
jgi:SAM-dependent methyltransferase